MPSSAPPASLFAHLRHLAPTHRDPLSLYAPLLSAVLSKLNEPILIQNLFDDLCPRLAPLAQTDEPDWLAFHRPAGDVARAKLVVAVRIREALLKVGAITDRISPSLPLTIAWPSTCSVSKLHFTPLETHASIYSP